MTNRPPEYGERRDRGARIRAPRRRRLLLPVVLGAVAAVAVVVLLVAVLVGRPAGGGAPVNQAESPSTSPSPTFPAPVATSAPSTADATSSVPTPDPGPSREPSAADRAEAAAGITGHKYEQHGPGTFDVVPGDVPAPDPDGKVRTLRVEVEKGLPIDGEKFADFALKTLNDKRSWTKDGYSFARTDGKDADTTLVLATPDTSAKMCLPLQTFGKLSCRNGKNAVYTIYRWIKGTPDFDGDLLAYRQYVINHEVGHSLGHGHEQCPGPGKTAPVMMQQTKSTGACEYNAWPYPKE